MICKENNCKEVEFMNREYLSEEINELIIPGIKNFVKNSGSKGVVLGISGGIDSAVVAALSVKALGDYWVKGVYMPCKSNMDDDYSEEEKQDKEDAINLSKWLGIEMSILDLTTPYMVFRHRVNLANGTPTGTHGEISQSACGNMKARMRMTALYALKEDLNYLCIGTGNLTEIELGYYTKYGDGGVDFEPIGKYYKTEVKTIADILGIKESVPSIFTKSPSARLSPGQTDERDIGASYDDIDYVLMCISNQINIPDHLTELGNKIINRISKNIHKRYAPPIIS